MRLLLVENERELSRALALSFGEAIPDLNLIVTASRDSAFEALGAAQFDLVVCDLKLPTTDGALDEDVAHGLAVRARVEDVAPGTPVLILSAHGTVDVLSDLLERARHEDIFGTRTPVPMIGYVSKGNLPACVSRARDIGREIAAVDDIEVATGGVPVELDLDQLRVLRIFARRHEGRVIRVSQLGGGLSAARVLRVRVWDAGGAMTALAVAKIGDWRAVRDERERYRTIVSPLLGTGSFTAEMDVVESGASKTAGIFYTLADEYDRSLFDLLRADAAVAEKVVGRLQLVEEPWRAGASSIIVRVQEVRRQLVSDEEATVTLTELEARDVQIRRCRQHGDLHGLNVLTAPPERAVLIDYGEVTAQASASRDPVTLELSLVFHPAAADIRGGWPRLENARSWDRLDEYLSGCPVPGFVRGCRQWAFAVSAGDREVYANTYAYAIRQLKYRDTNHDIAEAIARAAGAAFARH